MFLERRLPAFLCLIALCLSAPLTASAQESSEDTGDHWLPVPFRVRDLTFPTVLVMGFMPRPAKSLDSGVWALEFNYSASNNLQILYLDGGDLSASPLPRISSTSTTRRTSPSISALRGFSRNDCRAPLLTPDGHQRSVQCTDSNSPRPA